MGASKELFMALRQGLMDGVQIEEERRNNKRYTSSTIIKGKKGKSKGKKDDEPKEHR